MSAHGRWSVPTDEANERSKDGNGGGDDVSHKDRAKGAGKPRHPVDRGVGSEMPRACKDADENVLAAELRLAVARKDLLT